MKTYTISDIEKYLEKLFVGGGKPFVITTDSTMYERFNKEIDKAIQEYGKMENYKQPESGRVRHRRCKRR